MSKQAKDYESEQMVIHVFILIKVKPNSEWSEYDKEQINEK